MRLVCPNCEAKYEVPEDAIPETGRDVQCANCGHAWYQMRPKAAGSETAVAPPTPPAPEPVVERAAPAAVTAPPAGPGPDAAPAAAGAGPDEGAADATETTEAGAAAEAGDGDGGVPAFESVRAAAVESPAAAVSATAGAAVADGDAWAAPVSDVGTEAPAVHAAVAETVAVADAVVTDATEADDASGAEGQAATTPYAVDESVLAILREEAEREAQARRAEAARPLETQTDLGIEAAVVATKKAVEVASHTAEAESDDRLANRRTRLPDVEEINSTLRPGDTAADGLSDPASAAVEGRSSFRSGFLLVLTVAILAAALYASADAIADLVPALAGPLKAYVGFVDSLRLQLDGLMQSATVAINGN